MTSLGDKKKDDIDLSAKYTAANSNSTRLSRIQAGAVSARNKTAVSAFYSDKQGPQSVKRQKELSADSRIPASQVQRHYNTIIVGS